MSATSIFRTGAALLGAALLSGCGGQDLFFKNPVPEPAALAGAEGLYGGTTDTGRTLTALVLDDGTHYLFYSAANQPAQIRGFVQGAGTSTNGSYQSANAKDINIEGRGALAATVSASYVQKKSFSGSWTDTVPNLTTTFTAGYNAAYETKGRLDAIAGTYSGFLAEASPGAGGPVTNLTISATGAITMSNVPCTGTAAVRAQGNAYAITLSCNTPAVALTGIAHFNADTRQLLIGTMLADRSNGRLFAGTKL